VKIEITGLRAADHAIALPGDSGPRYGARMNTREGRDCRHEDDLFRHGDVRDSVPAIDELIRGVKRDRAPIVRGRNAVVFDIRHPVLLTMRYLIYGGVLLLGLALMIGFAVGAAGHYGDAAVLAQAPPCAQGVDLATTTTDCVGSRAMTYDFGTYDVGDDLETIDLDLPGSDDEVVSPEFPSSVEFDDAAGLGGTLRATYWEGRIVTLTASSGDEVVTVVTVDNPNVAAGTEIAGTLFGTSMAMLALFLFGVSRPVRRWLPPGRVTPFVLTALALCTLGCFFTAVGLTLQPEHVLRAGIIGPAVVAALLGISWLPISRRGPRRTAR
jgi:hypothetical protein